MQELQLIIQKKRIWEIDFLRGIAVLFMIFDHMMYDFIMFSNNWMGHYQVGSFIDVMGNFAFKYWSWIVRVLFRVLIVTIFFSTSGISSSFSKNNFIRGFRILAIAMLLTVITHIGKIWGMIDFTIDIGVLHCLALSIILYEVLKKLKIGAYFIAGIGCIIILGGYCINQFDMVGNNDIFAIFGLATNSFVASQGDYFPLLPWAGMLLMGGVLGQVLYSKRTSLFGRADRGWNRPISFIGRHALLFYFGHQVLIFGIFYLFGEILGYN